VAADLRRLLAVERPQGSAPAFCDHDSLQRIARPGRTRPRARHIRELIAQMGGAYDSVAGLLADPGSSICYRTSCTLTMTRPALSLSPSSHSLMRK